MRKAEDSMIEQRCVWCDSVHPAKITRTGPDWHEWECCGCRKRWTMKDGDAYHWYPFNPDDIDAAFSGHFEGWQLD
jgi:hypothetical protein